MDHGPIKDISVDEVPIETVVKNFYEAQGDTEAKAAKGGRDARLIKDPFHLI
jgi:hypothetical protein